MKSPFWQPSASIKGISFMRHTLFAWSPRGIVACNFIANKTFFSLEAKFCDTLIRSCGGPPTCRVKHQNSRTRRITSVGRFSQYNMRVMSLNHCVTEEIARNLRYFNSIASPHFVSACLKLKRSHSYVQMKPRLMQRGHVGIDYQHEIEWITGLFNMPGCISCRYVSLLS